ncbi:hypothetical protein [Meiothermus taiwanensis]|jgi:hypothetical protein|uniref:Uncharacterized protein n=2 Tax=Meiothermus taiwanensis TaxID=172827 RepID=A0A399E153_9DEIN|nr:hypothetical protein [Meiothermus taiwanensis]AWR85264.1 hypothetical protein Mtai_v1c00120 [Meiothermus taiwanensis WR-220]KIQ55743.1 hypothetical protein SY28_01395 [Meiothermus taiwanensis]KZK17030.1 hypothetical protein A3962_03950 [Meiothermus taiwanensis]RIH75971.1 hypothetical protein Mcate_01963 [Meiothermus taiwanensis]
MAAALPEEINKKLEAFKRIKGRRWVKELEKILDEAVKLSNWDAEVRKAGAKASKISDQQAVQMAVEAVRKARKKQ